MTKIILTFWILLLFCSCAKKNGKDEQFIPSAPIQTTEYNHYKKGETISYIAKLGIMKAANIILHTDTSIQFIDSVNCYKVSLLGELDGTVDLFSELNDKFYSYVDTSTLKPKLFIRDLQENKYKKREYSYFDFITKKVKIIDKNVNRPDSIKTFDISENINDMITSYFQLRKIDFQKYSANDTLRLDVFVENNSYNLKFLLKTREELKTKIGKYKTIVLVPIVPDNELFRGEEPVSVWISDDENRIPLKLKAKSWVGNIEVEIKEYSYKR